MFAVTVTPSTITVLIDGRPKSISSSHANFSAVKETLKLIAKKDGYGPQDAATYIEHLKDLLDIRVFVEKASAGRVRISDNAVQFDGKPVHGVIAERLLMLLREGHDVMSLATFLDRVNNNPLESARNELYLFLEASKLPLTSDGCFLAYKSVRDDYLSHYDGKTSNKIGDFPSVPRDECDTDRYNTCSSGVHFCAFDYLSTYSSGRIMICKVKPEDVTAIPSDYNNMKGRAWIYEIVGEIPREDRVREHLTDHGYNDDYDGAHSAMDTGTEGYYDPGKYQTGVVTVDTTILEEQLDEESEDEDTDAAVDRELAHIPDDPNAPDCDCDTVCKGVVEGCLLHEPDRAALEKLDADLAVPKAPKNKKITPPRGVFEHNGTYYHRGELKRLITKYGVNGTAREKGIPRSALQGWIKRFK